MDLQETFDAVVRHLRQQGHQSVNRAGTCVYLSPDGSRCAVGALIPDGHPATEDTAVNGLGIHSLLGHYPDLEELLAPSREHLWLLASLQLVHDDPNSWTSSGLSAAGWKALRRVALAFRLDDSVTRPLRGAG